MEQIVKQRKMEKLEEWKRILSQCRVGNIKPPRGRFPKYILDKVGPLSQRMARVFIYFIPFQKRKYTKKLRGDLDMKLCQFISHTLIPMIFLVTSSTWVIKFLLSVREAGILPHGSSNVMAVLVSQWAHSLMELLCLSHPVPTPKLLSLLMSWTDPLCPFVVSSTSCTQMLG